MRIYIIKRTLLFIPTMLLVSTLVFGILRVVPGDPAISLLSGGAQTETDFTEEDLQRLRAKLGTDRPIFVQYTKWALGLVRLDFGTSFFYDQPVWGDMKKRFPITFELALMALLMAGVVAIPIGIISAIRQDSWPDYVGRILTIGGIAVPNFWIGIMFVYMLANVFNWLPPLGYEDLWDKPLDNLQQLVFPAIALALTHMAFVARVTRSAALEVMREDYIRTARAKGAHERVVVYKHALRNGIIPVVTAAGLQIGNLLSGALLVEFVFAWPGIGRLMITSIFRRDSPMVVGIVIFSAAMVIIANLLTDLVYRLIDPRIRVGGSR